MLWFVLLLVGLFATMMFIRPFRWRRPFGWRPMFWRPMMWRPIPGARFRRRMWRRW